MSSLDHDSQFCRHYHCLNRQNKFHFDWESAKRNNDVATMNIANGVINFFCGDFFSTANRLANKTAPISLNPESTGAEEQPVLFRPTDRFFSSVDTTRAVRDVLSASAKPSYI